MGLKILIVPQPNFPVPPINDGAAALIIYDTLSSLQNKDVKALTFYDTRMNKFNLSDYYFVYKCDSKTFKIQRKVAKIFLGKLFSTSNLNSKYFDYLVGIILTCIRTKIDAVIVHTTKWNWVFLIRKALQLKSTKVIWYHHNSEDQDCSPEVLQRFTEIDAHIFVSEYSKRVFNTALKPIDSIIENKSYVVHNGIRVSAFSPNSDHTRNVRESLGIDNQKIVISFVGRLIERKGFHRLFEAMCSLPAEIQKQISLLLVGAVDSFSAAETAYTICLHKQIAESKFDFDFVNTGYVPHSQMPEIINASDIIVIPSLEQEGMPLVLLEAQCSAKPVICSNVGGTSEIIDHGINGFLLSPPGDIQQIAEYVTRLVKDKELAKNIGLNGRKNIAERFTDLNMASSFISTINRIFQ